MRVRGAIFLTVFGLSHLHAQTTAWRDASGEWNDASLWSAGRPTGFLSAVVRGNSLVIVPRLTPNENKSAVSARVFTSYLLPRGAVP